MEIPFVSTFENECNKCGFSAFIFQKCLQMVFPRQPLRHNLLSRHLVMIFVLIQAHGVKYNATI